MIACAQALAGLSLISIELATGMPQLPDKLVDRMLQLLMLLFLLPILFLACRRSELPLREQLALCGPRDRQETLRWHWMFLLALAVACAVAATSFLHFGGRRPDWADPATWLKLVSLAVITPIAEELLFRGYLMGRLAAAGLTEAASIRMSTLVFVLPHLADKTPRQFAATIGFIGAYGAVLGIIRAKTGSVLPSIVLHSAINLTLIGLAMAFGR